MASDVQAFRACDSGSETHTEAFPSQFEIGVGAVHPEESVHKTRDLPSVAACATSRFKLR